MPINPGRLDRRITIQEATESQGTAGGVVQAWADVSTVWAEVLEQGTREFRAAGAWRSEVTRGFRVRYGAAPTLTAKHRILYNGRLHDIAGEPTEEVERGRKAYLLIPCKYTEGAN